MPKLRTPTTVLQNRTIVANIKYGMEMTGISKDELAAAMKTSIVTFYDRMKHPEHFRLQELRAVAAKLHMTVTDLISETPAKCDTA